MKKTIQNLSTLFFVLMLAIFAVSCSDDDDSSSNEPGSESDLSGVITEDRTLDPTVDYQLNSSLSVENGATLTIPAGTHIQTGTGTDVYIVVKKGADIEIDGTVTEPVMMGPSGNGNWGGLVILGDANTTAGASDVTAEVGGFLYGGSNNNDDSGSINYLIITGSGAQINSESQYNGLTLYAVGDQTEINNVAILNGKDDGIEFFGGTVNATNVYVENLEDDAIDWTEGWSGTLTNTYVRHDIEGFSTAIEADGVNNDPQIVNFRAVSTVGGTALQFKSVSGATVTGLSLTGYDTTVELADDDGDFANISINGAQADPEMAYDGVATVEIGDFGWVAEAIAEANEVILSGSITSDMELDASVYYSLPGSLSVENGATLTIPAGTTIHTGTGTDTYIVIKKGSDIIINGTADAPVRMGPDEAGAWGGLVILGNGITEAGDSDVTAEVGGFLYGGNDNKDDSGSISYLILEQTGAQINSESQYNGLTLYAVGDQTEINNVAILGGKDDGIEFFGGAVNATNIYIEDLEDDAIDWTEGWEGVLTNTYVVHNIEDFSTALEADGNTEQPTIENFTAVSATGGTALQFKSVSGAIITGLSLSGYDTTVELADDDGSFTHIQIEGADADPNMAYDADPTVDVTMFDWRNN